MADPSQHVVSVDGARLSLFEWGTPGESTVLLVHATGFHARCWDQVVAGLGGRHVIAVDMRGHGRSEKRGPYTWDVFGRDLVELVESMQLRNIVGVGHSMGGHSVTLAAAAHPDRFDRLLLVDPVILAPESYGTQAAASMDLSDHPVARRRNRFVTPDEMIERMRSRGSYAVWDPAVLRDYCMHGLIPDGEGDGYMLACPPDVEATIYGGSAGHDIYDEVKRVTAPVTVLRARERGPDTAPGDFSYSPTWTGLAARFADGQDVPLPHLTHFIPMQDPRLVAAHIVGDTPSAT